jgi:hypothetical protein
MNFQLSNEFIVLASFFFFVGTVKRTAEHYFYFFPRKSQNKQYSHRKTDYQQKQRPH